MNDASRMGEPRSGAVIDDPRAITRPDGALHTYYVLTSLMGVILFPFIYLPLRFKYDTLRYRFEDEGVSMSWGRFFQRETYLTYRRIQDIQVTSGVIQRRLGLADLKLQTASGGSGAEMKIEGIRDPDRLRDFLYERMRGVNGDDHGLDGTHTAGSDGTGSDLEMTGSSTREAETADGAPVLQAADTEALRLLHEIRDELRRIASTGEVE